MKLFNKIKLKFKKLNNSGSSIVLVVVALAFIGIIVGALLSSALYGYRQKLQDLNSKNNFYNVEQAMQEVHAGVGINTVSEMQKAYVYTLTNMVYFDVDKEAYVSLSDAAANELFKKKFMSEISDSSYFNVATIGDTLQSYISDDTVFLDKKKISIAYVLEDGSVKYSKPTPSDGILEKIIIKDVTLTRNQTYNNSAGKGDYTQTVSADIEIVKPEFTVNFSKTETEYPALFDYTLVGDAGIEISKFGDEDAIYDVNNVVNINGNLYGASDYYNHTYNSGIKFKGNSLGLTEITAGLGNEAGATKGNIKISATVGSGETARELWYTFVNVSSKGENADYDGEKPNSMFSGIYIDDANVSIRADQIIVPGSFSVMNQSDVNVFSGKKNKTEIWADDIILGGNSNVKDSKGAATNFNANLYVRDDTEINSYFSTFRLNGSYYGYGDSTSRDNREFVSSVDATNFTEDGTSSATTLRKHYNTSSIVVNGQNAVLDFANTKTLYLAGRAYIELSKNVKHNTNETTGIASDRFTYMPVYGNGENTELIRDYQTLESIAVKNNQLMYEVSEIGVPSEVTITKANGEDEKINAVSFARLDESALVFFQRFFPLEVFFDYIPCVTQQVDNTVVNYIDFDKAFSMLTEAGYKPTAAYTSAIEKSEEDRTDEDKAEIRKWSIFVDQNTYTKAFVKAYSSVMNLKADDAITVLNVDGVTDKVTFIGTLKEQLTTAMQDVSNNKAGSQVVDIDYGFADVYTSGVITDRSDVEAVYSSGAITTKKGSSLSFITETNSSSVLNSLINSQYSSYVQPEEGGSAPNASNLAVFNDDLERQYLLRKWTLNSSSKVVDPDEELYITSVKSVYGESAITPINYYMLMNNIADGSNTIDFEAKGGHVWISGKDVVINGDTKITDSEGNLVPIDEKFKGIIIAKGDVTIGHGIKSFQGTIVAGGKIYVDKAIENLSSSSNVCISILDDCLANKDDPNKLKLLEAFRMYDKVVKDYKDSLLNPPSTEEDNEEDEGFKVKYYDSVNIEAIDFSDVVSLSNWHKSVGGAVKDETP